MAKDVNDIKEKLKKLIAKEASARDIGNQAEADAFASKIQQLLLDYELEIDELMGEARVFEIGDECFNFDSLTRPHESDWIMYLYMACAPATFCRVMHFTPSLRYKSNHNLDPKGSFIMIMGEARNRELLHFMSAQLMVKIRELARKSFKEYDGPSKRNTYIRSFYKGACLALRMRLMDDQKKQAQEHGLVLNRDIKLKEYLHQWANQNNVRLGQLKTKNGSSTDGFNNGIKAGESVGIHKGVNGNYQPMKQLK